MSQTLTLVRPISAGTFLVNEAAYAGIMSEWQDEDASGDSEAPAAHSGMSAVTAFNFFEQNEGTTSVWRRSVDLQFGSLFTVIVNAFSSIATPVPTSLPTWVQNLYDASKHQIQDDQIIEMFDALENAIYSDKVALNETLAFIEIDRLVPEFAVGIPRALYPLRDHLPSWQPFVLRAWTSLSRRHGLDVRELLQGLL